MSGFFKPESDKFYPLYQNPAQKLVEMTKLLEKMLYVDLEQKKRIAREIGALEDQANDDRDKITAEIATSFVTPFERDDMFSLAQAIERAIGLIDNAAELLIMIQFDDVEYLPSKVTRQMNLIRSSADAIYEAMLDLKHVTKLEKFWGIVRDNEHQADHFRRSMLTKLYTREEDPIRLFKVKEIIELLEEIIDGLLHIAHVVEIIALQEQ
ncbi:MAG: DUF47 family protein [Bifidobacteriaceae bacterium]|jgi:uncharacterized protein Yka (UPF0111/DUF47 family)|nr:DUF47 family protein [Bifidobacteriaceae bacterium]